MDIVIRYILNKFTNIHTNKFYGGIMGKEGVVKCQLISGDCFSIYRGDKVLSNMNLYSVVGSRSWLKSYLNAFAFNLDSEISIIWNIFQIFIIYRSSDDFNLIISKAFFCKRLRVIDHYIF